MVKYLFAGILCIISLHLKAQEKTGILQTHVTINFRTRHLNDCIADLEKISKIHFYFNAEEINQSSKIVTETFSDKTIESILKTLLKETGLGYQQNSVGILIIKLPSGTHGVKPVSRIIIGYITGLLDAKRPLSGASVVNRRTKAGVVTDENGSFHISANTGDSLLVSAVGYKVKRVRVGEENTINIELENKDNALEEVQVVTTALGIKRQERSLGYATQTVSGDQLTNAMSDNWTDALSGKVAGLNLVRSNSGPGGSIKIILRGENNLTDGASNEALIVVDGVVVNQGSGRRSGTNGGETVYGTGSDNMPSDYGSNLNDINPEDIESVTVLKGPAAAALYGQRGSKGAIMITTKSGSKNKKLNINVRSNATFETVNRWPDLQYEYGQGTGGADYYSFGAGPDGSSTSATSSAYGPKFDGQEFYQFNPGLQAQDTVRTLWKPYKNQIRDFYTTGQTYTNTVSLEGGTANSTARFSATNVHNTWILPNTGYDRNSISMSFNNKFNDKLTIATNIDYTNKTSGNLPGAGYGNQSLMYWFIFWQPNANLDWLKNYWKNGQEEKEIEYPYSSYPTNPYAVSYEYLNKLTRNAVTGNIQATYNFTKEWSLQVRTSLDMAYEQRSQQRPWDASGKMPHGSYRVQDIFSLEQSSDFMLKYDKKINQDFNVTASVGGSALINRYKRDETRADSLYYPGIYSFANKRGVLQSVPWKSSYDLNSFYGLVTTAYKNYLYLDLTGREDWNSVLATPYRTDNAGFFYTSANLSFVLSDAFALPKYISFAKVRFSASQVGSGLTTPYITSFNYVTAGSLFSGGLQNPTLLPDVNLQPLKTTTYEAGTNVSLFKDRLSFDVALYTAKTKNQIISRTMDAASGYPQAKTNLAEVDNKGIEVSVNATPVQTKDFKWTMNINFSTNKNTVSGLTDSTIVLFSGPTGGTQIIAKNGGSTGDLYGIGFQRAPDGRIIYDPSTGDAELTNDVKYLGKTTPSGKISLGNTFTYKRFALNLLFDAQYGAVAYSLTSYKLAEQGKTTNTLPGRYNGIIGNGVVQNADGTFRKNDVIAMDVDNFYRSMYGSNNGEGSTFSTNFIKFREASLSYTINPKSLKKIGITKLTLGLYGRDLFIWTKWPDFDPEFGTLNGTDIIKGFEVGQFPSTRSFGANIILGF